MNLNKSYFEHIANMFMICNIDFCSNLIDIVFVLSCPSAVSANKYYYNRSVTTDVTNISYDARHILNKIMNFPQ